MVFKSTFEPSVPEAKYKDSLSLFYWLQLDKFAQRSLFVDFASGRQWSGREIKDAAGRVATFFLEHLELPKGAACVSFCNNSDWLQVVALGALFAGCSVCAGALADPEPEHEYMLRLLEPRVVLIQRSIRAEILDLRRRLGMKFALVILDDDADQEQTSAGEEPEQTFGLHRHLLRVAAASSRLPVLPEDPSQAAYVLLTSGSTGQPKPVARSHRNSLYVCHSLDNCQELWDLNESSVLAGHLPLDHGTGTFSIKMTLTKGLRMVIMENYYFEMLLEAVHRYAITDVILGSALLHNFMQSVAGSERLAGQFKLDSLRNMIAVGSPIPSHQTALEFMDLYPECSVRQSLGMTECGFVSFVKRADCRLESSSVGWLLPNLSLKLLELEEAPKTAEAENGLAAENCSRRKEVSEFERDGELFMGGPTVSPGYLGAQFAKQQKLAFMPDGFYRTFDVCQLRADGQIVIKGRCNDILCLGDGWKVLPSEIERVLLQSPDILEAAVVGIPHPELPSCHAPRAYVVASSASKGKLTEKEVQEFAAKHLSEPKHLVGGVKLMDHLPRITLGKVDKRSLRQADGY